MPKASRYPVQLQCWISAEMNERMERLCDMNLGDDVSGPMGRPDHVRVAVEMYLTYRGIPAAPRPAARNGHQASQHA